METIAARYHAPATVRQSYLTEFEVECPKCQRLAIITAGNPYFFDNAQLKCNHCGHSEKSTDLTRYKVSVRRNCDTCGKLISKVIPHSKAPVDALAIACPACGETRIYKPRNESYRQTHNNPNAGLAPIFGVPLWLQGSIRGELFWAYNRAHLHAIKEYVGAKLRERQTTTHTTMVEKLPQFIKEAKNRESLLKLIEKLERK
jgi:DNA-directed RNA polymerase subunit RPC12/RpoP